MNLIYCVEKFASIIEGINSKVSVFHADSPKSSTHIAECLLLNEIYPARSWWTALAKLSEGEATFLFLDEDLPDELIDIISQLQSEKSDIEVFDRRLSESVKFSIGKNSGKLFLIGNKSLLAKEQLTTIDPSVILSPSNYLTNN